MNYLGGTAHVLNTATNTSQSFVFVPAAVAVLVPKNQADAVLLFSCNTNAAQSLSTTSTPLVVKLRNRAERDNLVHCFPMTHLCLSRNRATAIKREVVISWLDVTVEPPQSGHRIAATTELL